MASVDFGTVSVPNSALTDVGEFNLTTEQFLGMEVTVATNALNGFSILGKMSDSGDWVTLYSLAADYTSPAGLLVGTSGDLTTQAVGSGWFLMRTQGLAAIKFQAKSSAAGGSSVSLKGTVNYG